MMLRNYCYCPSFPQLFASVCLFWKRPGESPCPRSWPVELGGRRLETILQVRVNQLLPRSPCQAAQCKRGIQALGLSPWDFTQDCYYSPAGNGEHTGEQTTGNEKVAPGSRHRMAYTEPEVTCPGGSLPFTCQGRASWKPRHARTASRFHEADRPHTGPQLHHRSPSLSQSGAGRGAGDEARAEGLLRCPHPCPRPPAAASRAWGSPVNDKPLCPIM